MKNNEFLFLGTGASAGVPMIGCTCPVCRSTNPRNKRLRQSALLQINDKVLLIDSGPDFRAQALQYTISRLDGVLLTHTHFDHVAGLDELRAYYLLYRQPLPILVSTATLTDLKRRYDYLFREKSWEMSLAAQLDFCALEEERGETSFLGIPIRYMSFEQGGMQVFGFRFGNFAYLSDIRNYPETIFEDLQGVETLVISALREKPSLMHLSFAEAIQFAERVGAQKVFFTHIGHDAEHEEIQSQMPSGMQLAYDGLTLKMN